MSDILSDLQAYSRRCELEARRHAERATEVKAEAEERITRFAGPGAEEHHKGIRDRAQAEADRELELARFKSERAKMASRGYLLARHPEETGDPGWREHHRLMGRALEAGLVTDRVD